jgi:IS30 family transposase
MAATSRGTPRAAHARPYASRAAACRVRSIEEIADAVGHINSTITKAVYRHQIRDEVTAAATAMDGIFGEASGS